ncbi:MAG: flavin reductase [Burkholderiaceae bacterium]|nr:flavin reductase [Burkholderiaceae bacterium]
MLSSGRGVTAPACTSGSCTPPRADKCVRPPSRMSRKASSSLRCALSMLSPRHRHRS